MKEDTILVGAHTSTAGGLQNALFEGQSIGATTIQLFTANQKRWDSKPLTAETIELWKKARETTGIQKIMSHDSYLINLGAPDPVNLHKSRLAFGAEIERCQALELDYLNFHPGAALTTDPQQCLDLICESLLLFKDSLQEGNLRLLIEATAGQGSSVGNRFEQLAYILQKTHKDLPIGVCIDTCHIFVAGYDIRTAEAWDHTLNEFDRIIGLNHLYAFHVNDSLNDFRSRVDRHAPLGEGKIGLAAFEFLMQDSRTRSIPKYLETPGKVPVWEREIKMLKKFANFEEERS